MSITNTHISCEFLTVTDVCLHSKLLFLFLLQSTLFLQKYTHGFATDFKHSCPFYELPHTVQIQKLIVKVHLTRQMKKIHKNSVNTMVLLIQFTFQPSCSWFDCICGIICGIDSDNYFTGKVFCFFYVFNSFL